jgi:glycosyltransferase involved in cell wall biosynthesis
VERRLRSIEGLAATSPWRRRLRPLVIRLRSMLVIAETRRVAKSLGDPADVGVVVHSAALIPLPAAALAPARGHWATFRHAATGARVVTGTGWRSVPKHLIARMGAARDRTRTRRGGRFVVVGAYPSLVRTWQQRAPWMATGVAAIPIEPAVTQVDRATACQQLGLTPDPRWALFFGSIHGGKSPDTVWAAWCLGEPPPAKLIAAGTGVRDNLDQWRRQHPGADDSSIHVIDGSIDELSKQLLFSVADVGVCSFQVEPIGASATLADFVAYDVAICCSSGGDPADQTHRYRLGEVFEAGDPQALTEAVRAVGDGPDPAGRAAFVFDHSPAKVAADLMRLLFSDADPS